jgi:hypothetical protein
MPMYKFLVNFLFECVALQLKHVFNIVNTWKIAPILEIFYVIITILLFTSHNIFCLD